MINYKTVRVVPYPVRKYTDAEIREFIAEDKKQTKQLKKKRVINKSKLFPPKN